MTLLNRDLSKCRKENFPSHVNNNVESSRLVTRNYSPVYPADVENHNQNS